MDRYPLQECEQAADLAAAAAATVKMCGLQVDEHPKLAVLPDFGAGGSAAREGRSWSAADELSPNAAANADERV